MNEDAMKKIYFAHKKIIKRWESQIEETPVVFAEGKKIRNAEVVPDDESVNVVHTQEDIPQESTDNKEVDVNNVDDIIKNFVMSPQGNVDDIINSV